MTITNPVASHVTADALIDIEHTLRVMLAERVPLRSGDDSGVARHDERTRAIEDALALIAAGRFGLCQSCGGEIPAARLEVVPTARVCVSCTVPA